MIIRTPDMYGTERDGKKNLDFCINCYKDGRFTRPNATLEDIVNFYAPSWGLWSGKPEMPLDEARSEVRCILAKLKRWKDISNNMLEE